jgi:hypothetical protein
MNWYTDLITGEQNLMKMVNSQIGGLKKILRSLIGALKNWPRINPESAYAVLEPNQQVLAKFNLKEDFELVGVRKLSNSYWNSITGTVGFHRSVGQFPVVSNLHVKVRDMHGATLQNSTAVPWEKRHRLRKKRNGVRLK